MKLKNKNIHGDARYITVADLDPSTPEGSARAKYEMMKTEQQLWEIERGKQRELTKLVTKAAIATIGVLVLITMCIAAVVWVIML